MKTIRGNKKGDFPT